MKSTMPKEDAVILLNMNRYQSIIDYFINNQSCSQMNNKNNRNQSDKGQNDTKILK